MYVVELKCIFVSYSLCFKMSVALAKKNCFKMNVVFNFQCKFDFLFPSLPCIAITKLKIRNLCCRQLLLPCYLGKRETHIGKVPYAHFTWLNNDTSSFSYIHLGDKLEKEAFNIGTCVFLI